MWKKHILLDMQYSTRLRWFQHEKHAGPAGESGEHGVSQLEREESTEREGSTESPAGFVGSTRKADPHALHLDWELAALMCHLTL